MEYDHSEVGTIVQSTWWVQCTHVHVVHGHQHEWCIIGKNYVWDVKNTCSSWSSITLKNREYIIVVPIGTKAKCTNLHVHGAAHCSFRGSIMLKMFGLELVTKQAAKALSHRNAHIWPPPPPPPPPNRCILFIQQHLLKHLMDQLTLFLMFTSIPGVERSCSTQVV